MVFSEYDYAMQDVRVMLNQPIERCRLFMVFDGRWKFIHASGFRPMLYDLETDPQELTDRGADAACADVVARLQSELFDWALHPRMHITTPNAKISAYAAQQLGQERRADRICTRPSSAPSGKRSNKTLSARPAPANLRAPSQSHRGVSVLRRRHVVLVIAATPHLIAVPSARALACPAKHFAAV